MPAVQTQYLVNIPALRPGFLRDMTECDLISRNVESAAGVYMGMPVSQGADARGCVVYNGSQYLGIAVIDRSVTRGNHFSQFESARIIKRGPVAVLASASVAAGDPVYVTPAGLFTNQSAGNALVPDARWASTTASGRNGWVWTGLPAGGGATAWNGAPTNNLMAELGHSFIANGQYQTDGYRSYGVATGAADESGQVVRRLGAAGAFGNGGDDTNQIDVRFDAALAACTGGTLYVWNGINDALLTVDQTLSKMLTWKQKAFAAKTNIIFHTIAPCGNDAFPANRPTTAAAADMKARNARMLAELPGTGSYVVDCFAQLLKPGTDFDLLEKWSPQDGKHPGNLYVQEVTAPADAIVLKQIYPAGPMDLPDATDTGALNTNVSLLAGLTTTYSTTPPTGYTNAKATGTTGTVIEYRRVTKNGVDWCEVRLSGTVSTANAAVDMLRQIGLQGGLVTGKQYEGWIEYDFDPGTAGVLSVQLGMQEAGSSTLINWDNNRYATQPMSALARAGRERTPPFTSIDGITDHRFRLSAYLATDVAPSGVFRFRIMKNLPVKVV